MTAERTKCGYPGCKCEALDETDRPDYRFRIQNLEGHVDDLEKRLFALENQFIGHTRGRCR